ncbi:MAG TPA: fimbria/pilus periplasmic chaperone [Lysobacter sp.]
MNPSIRAFGAALLAACALVSTAQANVLVGGTRVILAAKASEVTVRLSNDSERPALVQAWIDRGDAHSTPDTATSPFLVTPPMFRMEAKRDQNLRILYSGEPLPADRESLFWLNVLEVPPKPGADGAGSNYMQLALRSRLKFFFRPEGLAGDPLKTHQQVTFRTAAGESGVVLVVRNPTPYHVTLSEISVDVAGKAYEAATDMVAPFAELRLPIAGLTTAPAAGAKVTFSVINDYGAATSATAVTTTP